MDLTALEFPTTQKEIILLIVGALWNDSVRPTASAFIIWMVDIVDTELEITAMLL